MPCTDGGQSFPTDTVRLISGQRCICADDGEWVPLPDIGDGDDGSNAKDG